MTNIEADDCADGVGERDDDRHCRQRPTVDGVGEQRCYYQKAAADDGGQRRHRRDPVRRAAQSRAEQPGRGE
jgi:hypothetical protein